jgi:hypothetical protein
MNHNDDKNNSDCSVTAQRMKALLRGAFSGSPTQLKDISKATGEKRAHAEKKKPGGTS